MGVQRDVGGNPSIPPSSFWAQRSAQPVGIPTDILSKCIRIVIVAFGFSPILAYGRFAHGLRWGFHPHAPDKGFHPLTLHRFAQDLRDFSIISPA